jgi:hypothetical protein
MPSVAAMTVPAKQAMTSGNQEKTLREKNDVFIFVRMVAEFSNRSLLLEAGAVSAFSRFHCAF